jgi:hypothetical protein
MKFDEGLPLNDSHLPAIEAYVRGLFLGLPDIYRFHTLDHTLVVVEAAKDISEHEEMLGNQ